MAKHRTLKIGSSGPSAQMDAADTIDNLVNVSGPGYLLGRRDSGEGGHQEIAAGVAAAYTGELKMIAVATTPTGWLTCDGSAVSRTTYAALFSIIGTTFGVGDGSTTFNLPDMRDRFPVGASGTKAIASTGGAETVTLSSGNLPVHTHSVSIPVSTVTAVDDEPDSTKILGGGLTYVSQANEDESLSPFNTGSAGSGTAVTIIPKYVAIRYIICWNGLIP